MARFPHDIATILQHSDASWILILLDAVVSCGTRYRLVQMKVFLMFQLEHEIREIRNSYELKHSRNR